MHNNHPVSETLIIKIIDHQAPTAKQVVLYAKALKPQTHLLLNVMLATIITFIHDYFNY